MPLPLTAPPPLPKIDLHTHTHFSDGAHSPDFVINRARENGVSHLAVTDHDCLEGFRELEKRVSAQDVQLVPGAEISTRWENQEIHVLGLCVNPDDPALNKLLEQQQEKRWARMAAFETRLARAGIQGLGEYLGTLPCVAPGRAHVARFLSGLSASATPKKAFKALARNGRFYVPATWCTMADAIKRIRAAQGIAVLAHPHRYALGRTARARLMEEFCENGGEGIEICCSSMTGDKIEMLARLSLEHQLWVTAGSDFHTSEATWMDIGKLQQFPASVKKNAIWLHPRWHFFEKERLEAARRR